jgi:serine/threonine protein phosphatase PrpC
MSEILSVGAILILFVIIRIFFGFSPTPPKLELGVATTAGDREVQADQFDYASTEAGFMLALADGIGYGEKGRIAASVAVDTCRMQFEQLMYFDNPGFFFQKAFRTANHDILEVIDNGTAGSSLLCAVVSDGKLYYALAGNCRLAVYRKGDLTPLSEGHTIDILAKQSFKTGMISRKDALAAMKEQRIYNFVGQDGFKNIEYYDTPVQLQAGDVVVLMTDGVEEIFGAGRIEQLLHTRRSCEDIAFDITDSINKNQVRLEKDNATVMLLRVNSLGG